MGDVSKRLASLTPERRKLLEQLLARNGYREDMLPASDTDAPSASDAADDLGDEPLSVSASDAPMELPPNASPDEVKRYHRAVYDRLNSQLNAASYAEYIRFCNFGYVADSTPSSSPIRLPQHVLNGNTIQLVLEVIGDVDLTGRDVLDVGCGRGGTISVITQYFQPRRVAGIDLSKQAIAACRRNNRHNHVVFHVGDAESLPFEDRAFDVVTNIESSHSYPVIEAYYREVFRVLREGGFLLYTDLFPKRLWADNLQKLLETGFTIEQDRDITANVLLSCSQTAAGKRNAFADDNDQAFMSNFLGMPDSLTYRGMQSGEWTYRILKLKKGSPHG